MKKLLLLLLLSLGLIACSEKEPEFDYSISNGQFYTPEDEILIGCFDRMLSELNINAKGGLILDNGSVAGIYLNRHSIRACIDANFPFPGGIKEELSYTIEEKLDNHQYKVKICQKADGSMGSYWCKIVVQFTNRDNVRKRFAIKNILVFDKLGEWN